MHTQRLQPRDTAEAAEILRRGGLLGIPTETVYGLGANGLNPDAVGRIFAAKGRPQAVSYTHLTLPTTERV